MNTRGEVSSFTSSPVVLAQSWTIATQVDLTRNHAETVSFEKLYEDVIFILAKYLMSCDHKTLFIASLSVVPLSSLTGRRLVIVNW